MNWAKLRAGRNYVRASIPSPSSQPQTAYPLAANTTWLCRARPSPGKARALGRTLDGMPGLLYPIDPPKEGAWTAVAYELIRRRKTYGLSDEGCWTLTDAAAEGMELCPAYFGSFPVPPYTPWGWTLRHRALDNGVY